MAEPILPCLTGDALLQRFEALDGFLLAHQQLWRPKPFTELTLPWEAEHPELAAWLRRRSLEEADAAHNHPQHLNAPAPFPELAVQAARLAEVGELPEQPLPELPAQFQVDVPGRKWQQIEAFASRLSFSTPPVQWLDWCAGKGHLGRLLAHGGETLLSLERDLALVNDGQRMSDRLGLRAMHVEQDVLAEGTSRYLQPGQTAVALHACGDLHVTLLRQAAGRHCRQLAVAPCCYNRIGGERYRPLSAKAGASALLLSQDDLRLPLTETVTAGSRVRRQRDASMSRRLAFDLLQRELRGEDSYLPVPSVAPDWLHKPFADYCRDLAELKGLPTPSERDWAALEARGRQRLAEVRNLELLRGLFRRPLELWLLLDRALFLDEQGYRVHLGAFCPASLTPRNLLIVAERV